ncbi:transposase [Bosea thiooxidans]|uniref:transposase n=1 Tax=Bosea thiooxidans TaxID=53254 RepID=UPI001FCCC91F|nr:transposase [Bosea thiooxidans]
MKIAVRVQETISRIRLSYAACHPEADLFQGLVTALAPQPRGAAPQSASAGP